MPTKLPDEQEKQVAPKPEPMRPLPHGGLAERLEEGEETEVGEEIRVRETEPDEPGAVEPDPLEPPFSDEPETPPHPWT